MAPAAQDDDRPGDEMPTDPMLPPDCALNPHVRVEPVPHLLEDALRVLRPDGSAPEEDVRSLADARCRDLYGWMMLTRAFEERCLNLQRQGRISFFVTSTGQEAAQVGSTAALNDADWIFPAYREPAAALMRGVPLRALIDQLMGNAADLTRGRQMPCHYSFSTVRYTSISSPIGTQITQAVGAGMAAKIRGRRLVTIVYFGDGATSSNDFHSGLNFAGVYHTPTVFFCQNNQWAISMPVQRQTASGSIAVKAKAYGFPGVRVDGNDLLAVYRATREAVERARQGGGPTLIESITYRIHSHTTSDDATRYRDGGEVKAWQDRDPLERFRRHLEWRGIWTPADEEALWARSRQEVAQAIQAAEATPPPAVATIFDDIYAEMPAHIKEQRDRLLASIQRRNQAQP
jgi:2-oxoisovalerate dehydrogenase E1 component alpha subunit